MFDVPLVLLRLRSASLRAALAIAALAFVAPPTRADVIEVWVHRHGNVVLAGSSYNVTNNSNDYYAAKYAAGDGALLWEKRFSGPAFVGDSSHCLALGPNGMVAVTDSNGGYATVVYREVPSVSTGVRLRFTGESGRIYQIERAPTITGPRSILAMPTAPIGGLIEYHDMNPPPGQAFDRTVQP